MTKHVQGKQSKALTFCLVKIKRYWGNLVLLRDSPKVTVTDPDDPVLYPYNILIVDYFLLSMVLNYFVSLLSILSLFSDLTKIRFQLSVWNIRIKLELKK